MPISMKWDNDAQTVLRVIFWNEWEIEEYIATFEKANQMIRSVAHTVDVIVDLRTGSFVPRGNLLRAFRHVMDNLPENVGLLVYVNDDAVQRHLLNTYTAFYYTLRRHRQRRLFMTETLTQAYDLIRKHRTDD